MRLLSTSTILFIGISTAASAQVTSSNNWTYPYGGYSYSTYPYSAPTEPAKIVTNEGDLQFIGTVQSRSSWIGLSLYEDAKHQLYLYRSDAPILKIDTSATNKSQLDAMLKALKENNGTRSKYYVDGNGNFIGPRGIKVIQASPDWGKNFMSHLRVVFNGEPNKLVYNVKSDDIKKDFNPEDAKVISPTKQMEDFEKDFTALMKKYPDIKIDSLSAHIGNTFMGFGYFENLGAPANASSEWHYSAGSGSNLDLLTSK